MLFGVWLYVSYSVRMLDSTVRRILFILRKEVSNVHRMG